jgi:hypothetical protein
LRVIQERSCEDVRPPVEIGKCQLRFFISTIRQENICAIMRLFRCSMTEQID